MSSTTTSSPARIAANRANALKSTGPKTPEGKLASRANALTHGLTGEGVVLTVEDAAEVDRRSRAFVKELRPSGEVGLALVRRAAVLSVRLDRSVTQETATLSERVRRTMAEFEVPEGIDALEAEQLRAEAGRRALFDPSKEATLARKYEAAAERGFFRALKELRQVEKAAKAASPDVEAERFEATMASIFQLDQQVAEFEKRYPEPAPMAPSRSVVPPLPTDFARLGGRGDVPFTIGKRR